MTEHLTAAKIDFNHDLGSTIATIIDSDEYNSLPIEDRMEYIFTVHKNERIDTPLIPKEIKVIREFLEIEDLEPTKDITISGASYTGKNSIADLAAQILDTEHWDGKEEYDRRKKDAEETGKDDNDVKDHFEFDEKQRQNFRNYNPEAKGIIKQARLAAINRAEAWDEIDVEKAEYARKRQRRFIKEPHLPSEIHAVSFLIEASDTVRVDRAYVVYKKRMKENETPESEWLSKDQFEEERVTRRDMENLEKWRLGHKYYLADGKKPFDGDLTRPNGMPVYDFIISTTKRTPLEAAILMIKRYKEAGGFRKKPNLEIEKLTIDLIDNGTSKEELETIIKGVDDIARGIDSTMNDGEPIAQDKRTK